MSRVKKTGATRRDFVRLCALALLMRSTSASPAPAAGTGRLLRATPADYLGLLRTLEPGDTLVLDAGRYGVSPDGRDTDAPPGLPVFGLRGRPEAPITICGPGVGSRPVLLGRGTHNTIRIANSAHVVIRDIEIDGRDRGGAGVSNQGPSHHITLDGLVIHGVGSNQQVVGISTVRAPAWHWTVRRCTISRAGTGMYFGNSDGSNPFVAGTVEYNLVTHSIGYNVQFKHQARWPEDQELPPEPSMTVFRHNVLGKAGNSAGGHMARPNFLIGDVPAAGTGSQNRYAVYGNLILGNPAGALIQAEGDIALYANLLVNEAGEAVVIRPHNGQVRRVRLFGNTILAAGSGMLVSGADLVPDEVFGNAIFSTLPPRPPLPANSNLVRRLADADAHFGPGTAAPDNFDLYPAAGKMRGQAALSGEFSDLPHWDRDFNGRVRDWSLRGAYSGEGGNPGWSPRLEFKPPA